jgi:hypothetical protein
LFRAVFNGRPVSSASFGMRTDWVWAQARAGLIPHIRLGRYRSFRESAVEAWLRELEAKSTALRRPRRLRCRCAVAPDREPAARRLHLAGQVRPRDKFQKKLDPVWTPWRVCGRRPERQKPRICGAAAARRPHGRQKLMDTRRQPLCPRIRRNGV